MIRIFKKTKYKLNESIDFIGFDVETANNNKDFVCCSFYGENIKKVVWDLEEVIKILQSTGAKKKRRVFVATNLEFDFFAIFKSKQYHLQDYKVLYRNSKLIGTVFKKGHSVIRMVDTLNYTPASVSKLGEMLNIPKLEHPDFLGKFPKNQQQKEQLDRYCLNDSKISYYAMTELFKAFKLLGANFKLTIASISMSIFRNKYLKKDFFCHNIEIIEEILKGYYGGRTEVFKRGCIEFNKESNNRLFYYDINSLFPSKMFDTATPNPNTLRINHINDTFYINTYEGFSDVSLFCPYDIDKPLIPYRDEKTARLIFPVGHFRGYYSNIELREALKEGYIIEKIHKNIFYTESINIFEDFVKDLYDKRLKYTKENNNIMSYACKIILNSLYGKFAQKPDNRKEIYFNDLPEGHENFVKIECLENNGINIFICEKKGKPAIFCFPEISAYITASARIELYKYIKEYDPYYVDTDSIFINKKLPEHLVSKELGKMKLEDEIYSAVFIKPKFYAINSESHNFMKCKGIRPNNLINSNKKNKLSMNIRFDYNAIFQLEEVKTFKNIKFTKFKESMRLKKKKIGVNEIRGQKKNITFEDNKRIWFKEIFDIKGGIEISKPINLDDYLENSKNNNIKPIPMPTPPMND